MTLAAKGQLYRAFDEEGFLDFLEKERHASAAQIAHLKKLSRMWGSKLSEVLYGADIFESHELSGILSSYVGAPLLSQEPLSENQLGLMHLADLPDYLKHNLVPLLGASGDLFLVCTVPTESVIDWAETRLGASFYLTIATPQQVRELIQKRFRNSIDHQAREKLFELAPNNSAKLTLTGKQQLFLLSLPSVLGVCFYLDFDSTFIALAVSVNAYYTSTLVFRSLLTFLGSKSIPETEVSQEDLDLLDEENLPVYTVMVAMYKEAPVLSSLTQHLRELDYPRSKLEIKIVLEQDDEETLAAANKLHLENFFEFIIIPSSLPTTKPKALNFGLQFAKGEFITIYDAEDRPDPQQLKKAIVIFDRLKDIACIQARLNYFNSNENLLTRMFTIEYSQWFDFFLLGLYRLNIPIPLGGTSNHFRAHVLRELGGWDPYNVTEDADLGLRMEKNGHRVAILNSTTFEEANTQVGNWIRQRSRWLKGHMQTFLIHMRNPILLFREIGPSGFFGFMLFIGGPVFIALLNPVLWGLVLSFYFLSPEYMAKAFPPLVIELAELNLVLGNSLFVLLGAWAVVKRKNWKLLPWTIFLPVYWLLQSIAAYKALYQLVVKPHFWEKTTHGLSEMTISDKDPL